MAKVSSLVKNELYIFIDDNGADLITTPETFVSHYGDLDIQIEQGDVLIQTGFTFSE